ncbi:MAG TPA: S1/P1 nuclease [Candidatus Ozemobacteraceae bacterium]|nr:S1/P1 nuclease [Candidatus Ozemobacteraceae bacterium]
MNNQGRFNAAFRSLTLVRASVFILACLLCGIPAADAWSGPGHRIIAILVADILRTEAPEVYAEAQRLLEQEQDAKPEGNDHRPRTATLVSIAGWADHIRPQRPETGHYHVVEIPFDAAGYDETRDGAGGKYIVHAVQNMRRTLGDVGQPDQNRLEALKFLVHLVGDAHQPLHCTNRGDMGGNTTMVWMQGEKMKLHHVWDFRIVESFGMNEKQLAGLLLGKIRATDTASIATGTVTDWVNESHGLGQTWGYSFQPGSDISPEWLARVRPVVEIQLMRAAVRLAGVLREALKPPSRQERIELLRRRIQQER